MSSFCFHSNNELTWVDTRSLSRVLVKDDLEFWRRGKGVGVVILRRVLDNFLGEEGKA